MNDFVAEMNRQWDEIVAKDAAARDAGTLIGRYYSEPVADGSALYEVVKVTKKTIRLRHINYGDGYQIRLIEQMGCKLPREIVEQNINQRDKWEERISPMKFPI